MTSADRPAGMDLVNIHFKLGDTMFREIGKTVRHAMKNWGNTIRMCICVLALTLAVVAILWASPF